MLLYIYTIQQKIGNTFDMLKIAQYSKHRNSMKNHCRQKIKTFENLKSLLLKSVIDFILTDPLPSYTDTNGYSSNLKIFYELYKNGVK